MTRLSNEDRELRNKRIHELHALGLSQRSIGDQVGCGQTTVCYVLDPNVEKKHNEQRHRRHKRDPVGTAVRAVQSRAKRFGIPFDPKIEDELRPLPNRCPACNTILKLNVGRGTGVQPNSPSIDRRIPELGYTPGNVLWLCFGCNVIKGTRSTEEFKAGLVDWALGVLEASGLELQA